MAVPSNSTGKNAAAKSGAKKSTTGKVAAPSAIDLTAALSPVGLAHELAKAADLLLGGLDSGRLGEALEANLELWAAIKTLAERRNGQLDGELRQTLLTTAETVFATTFSLDAKLAAQAVEWLVSANLRLSQGLSSAVIAQMTRDHAYHLWQQAGCPHGEDQDFWYAAERALRAAAA